MLLRVVLPVRVPVLLRVILRLRLLCFLAVAEEVAQVLPPGVVRVLL